MRILAHIDGGFRRSKKKAAYGYIMRLSDKSIYWEGKVFDCTTNNIAEYTALIQCLEKAIEFGCYHIEIKSDSKLIVNQVNKKWKCNYVHLQVLLDRVWKLLDKIDYWELNWIPREQNKEADWIVNYAFKEVGL